MPKSSVKIARAGQDQVFACCWLYLKVEVEITICNHLERGLQDRLMTITHFPISL